MRKLMKWIIFAKEETHVHKLFQVEDPKAAQMIPKVLGELKDGIYLKIPKKRSCKNDANDVCPALSLSQLQPVRFP